MSLYEYEESKKIDSKSYEFYPLIMAAMRRADDQNLEKLRMMWPDIYLELKARYNAPGGKLKGD